ncbi:MAG: rod shape-determining protein [Clostridia bacterium]|nr:rod shape-determining protein [Clostridia bacterium]
MNEIGLAIDLGSATTSIHKVGSGLIVSDESRVTVMTRNNKMTLIESGKGVEKYIKTPSQGYQTINTVDGGVITNEKAAICMLKDYISRCLPGNTIIKPKIKALVLVGQGVGLSEKRDIEKVLRKSGASEVIVLESPVAVAGALGYGRGHFIVDIGSSKTEIAIVGGDGIVTGCSVDIGGDKLTKAIADYMVTSMSSTVPFSLAEKIKRELGSMYDNNNMSMRVNVRKIGIAKTQSEVITSKEIFGVIEPYIADLVNIIYNMSFQIPEDLSGDIVGEGIVLCGGGAKLAGLDEYISKFMKMKAKVVEDPTTIVSRGGMHFLETNTDFAKILNVINYR